MRKCAFLLLAVLFVTASLAGCSPYVPHYYAIMRVCTNDSDSASLIFGELDGTDVFKLKCRAGEELRYSGKLEEGSLTVYYDCGGDKKELFSLRDGDEVSASADALPAGTVYIIVETSGKCRGGDLAFELMDG